MNPIEITDPGKIIKATKSVVNMSPIQSLDRFQGIPKEIYNLLCEKVKKEGIKIVQIRLDDEVMLSDPPIYTYYIVWLTSDGRVFKGETEY